MISSAARLDAADAPPHPARATRATSHPKAPCVVAARDGMLFVCTAISLHASLTPFLPAECSRSCAAGAQLWHDLARVSRSAWRFSLSSFFKKRLSCSFSRQRRFAFSDRSKSRSASLSVVLAGGSPSWDSKRLAKPSCKRALRSPHRAPAAASAFSSGLFEPSFSLACSLVSAEEDSFLPMQQSSARKQRLRHPRHSPPRLLVAEA